MAEKIYDKNLSSKILRRALLTTAALFFVTVLCIFPAASEEVTPAVPSVLTSDNYLTFSTDNQFTLKTNKNWDGKLYYSTDAEMWYEWNGEEITSSLDGKLYLRGEGNTLITGGDQSQSFVLTPKYPDELISCTGNIENLLNYTKVANGEHPKMGSSCFAYMFYGCTNLVKAPELQAETLSDCCYEWMFSDCTNLAEVPELKATVLAEGCYRGMFSSCTSLTAVSELSETDLAKYCYASMFAGCTGLITVPEDLLQAPELKEGCYQSMFEGCTSLTTVPKLPAQNLAFGCYKSMFRNCIGLTTVPYDLLPASDLSDKNFDKGAFYCYQTMFEGCTSLTTIPDLPATKLKKGCYDGMFNGCTSLTTVPNLPATELAEICYRQMFQGCNSLYLGESGTKEWTISATTNPSNWNTEMFNGCMGNVNKPQIGTIYYLIPDTSTPIYTVSFEGEGYIIQKKPANIMSGVTKTFIIVPKNCKKITGVSATNSTLESAENDGVWTCTLSYATDTVIITVTTEDNHEYSISTYTWYDDNSCKAQQQCKCGKGTSGETEDGTITGEVIQQKSCSDDEFTKYTSSFTKSAFADKTKTVKTAENSHDYGAATYTWSPDNSTCTAERICNNHPEQKETETVDAVSVITQPQSCEDDQLTTYTATFANAAFTMQIKEVKTADKLGHAYGDLIPQKDATHTETGLKAHYFCDVCDTYFTADKVKTTRDALVIPKLPEIPSPPTPQGSSIWLTEIPTQTPTEPVLPIETPTQPTQPNDDSSNDGRLPLAGIIGGGLAVLIIAGLVAFAVFRRR